MAYEVLGWEAFLKSLTVLLFTSEPDEEEDGRAKRKNLISDGVLVLIITVVVEGGGLHTDCCCHPSHTFELATSVVLFDVVVASEVFGLF